MKRSASLDFLRGVAAFAVAIPHYLTANAPFQPFAESFAIAGVEVFFVLSGFVLAPQIVDWVVDKPWRNLGVFLVRRWMRTIPPYVVALVVIAALDRQPADRRFRALSLLCREPLFLRQPRRFLSRRLESRGRGMVLCAVCSRPVSRRAAAREGRPAAGDRSSRSWSFSSSAALRFSISPHDWDLNVRRVTLFRINSIVWGFLLYLALERRSPIASRRQLRPMAPRRATGPACDCDSRRARRRDPGRRAATYWPSGRFLTSPRRSA